MTAAHCTEDMAAGELTVVVGEHDLSDDNDVARTVVVAAIHEHPDYVDAVDHGDDFAILELAENLNFSSHVRPACLPKVDDDDVSFAGVRGNFVVVG